MNSLVPNRMLYPAVYALLLTLRCWRCSVIVARTAFIPGDRCPARFDQLTNETELGRNMLKYFMFERGYVNLNHGAFGAAPKMVLDCQHFWQRQSQVNPIRWIRHEYWTRMHYAANQMAQYLGVEDSRDLAFVPNVSAGINAVLRSLKLNSSDVVVYFSEAFGTVKLAIKYVTDFMNATSYEIPVSYPFEDHEILEALEKALINFNGRVRLVSISHISAFPAAIFSVREITRLARLHSVLVLVDAAHVLGQMRVNLTELDPDFYVCNGYKWFYTPQGAGVMYVKKVHQRLVHPAVISWNYKRGFQLEFHMQGTTDYSAFLTFPAAMDFRRRLGEDRIMNYIHGLAEYAGTTLSSAWNTDLLLPAKNIAMVNVRLPVETSTNYLVPSIVEHLLQWCRTFVNIFKYQNQWYLRVSAQIYNEKSDYDMLATRFLEIQRYLEDPANKTNPYCPGSH